MKIFEKNLCVQTENVKVFYILNISCNMSVCVLTFWSFFKTLKANLYIRPAHALYIAPHAYIQTGESFWGKRSLTKKKKCFFDKPIRDDWEYSLIYLLRKSSTREVLWIRYGKIQLWGIDNYREMYDLKWLPTFANDLWTKLFSMKAVFNC